MHHKCMLPNTNTFYEIVISYGTTGYVYDVIYPATKCLVLVYETLSIRLQDWLVHV